ncbi:CDP-alcohol phosphatidyltransferase family protein [Kineosporia rhizophila]|uniref:CDP-alcohol phosphatidyltransferase family protein n=1 Tax=Kineosporia TaxID=49184 RepID=UPI001E484993|nr:CDP-alcohol phosphatidyltransferase family protein [Kineosporia sp. NBRC 101677]MCE0539485.1 CDP-alcohol phosphatidyltransferase family protein [Kineosporia rhizophila]
MGENPVGGTRVLNIPNLLSFGRLLLVPVFAVLIVVDHVGWAVVVLMVSGFTDYLDGNLARRWGQTTRLGQILDPIADRLFILTTLLGLAYRDVIPWWLVLLLIARDAVLVGSLLLMTHEERRPLEVSFLGKAATANLLYAFPLLLLGDIDGRAGDVAMTVGWAFAWWGTALYWWSALIYLRQAAAVMARRDQLTRRPQSEAAG